MKAIVMCLVLLLTTHPLFSQKSKKLEELFSTYEKAGLFNGSVLIAEKGKVIFENSYGYRNAPKKEKNTNNSLYRVFSTTKMFTATVIFNWKNRGNYL
ncbi:CubicO group peptidase (beta-lactamase class C family) [Chryseobacterium vietnamense]|uniref:serine hydrolase n=1 Tax=Chryseobacterium vietnamense TaxID=866785 RepID=UPI0028558F95|nr:CubicO group peptidase (beta-lactamase class C family) [Chryseobacterium vietnamense]